MPQFDPATFPTQIFWLLVSFVGLYLILWKLVIPRITDVLAMRQEKIEDDLACESCGYNVRGLTYGRDCPECGVRIRAIRPTHDMLLNTAPVERHRWRTGLWLAGMCVAMAQATVAMFAATRTGRPP